jgi:hypothetical protein
MFQARFRSSVAYRIFRFLVSSRAINRQLGSEPLHHYLIEAIRDPLQQTARKSGTMLVDASGRQAEKKANKSIIRSSKWFDYLIHSPNTFKFTTSNPSKCTTTISTSYPNAPFLFPPLTPSQTPSIPMHRHSIPSHPSKSKPNPNLCPVSHLIGLSISKFTTVLSNL